MENKKLWQGRLTAELNADADMLNKSIGVDIRMLDEDIAGSVAHATMLADTGIISAEECAQIKNGLLGILADVKSGELAIDYTAEDVHSFVENTLTARIGATGKKLHTARSRNDQVALDLRLNLKKEIGEITVKLKKLILTLADKADKHKTAVMPGYTHTQRAQPITFAQHLLCYTAMLLRDADRLSDCKKRLNVSPLGSCALAGTTYPIDRQEVATLLGMDGVSFNSMDGVSDRDFVTELCFAISVIMQHLSRLAEEVILWSSWEFGFVSLSDSFSTGSSIMPQKKNADIAELIRGKCGRVYGNLVAFLTVMKALPLAYNKDMQEDKELVFDSIDTVKLALDCFAPMIDTMTVNEEKMLAACKNGYINATDCADYLTKKGMPFREAYKLTGMLVAKAIAMNKALEDLPFEVFTQCSTLFEKDIYAALDMTVCTFKRNSEGAAALASVEKQITLVKKLTGDKL